jgi:hypothetical protein
VAPAGIGIDGAEEIWRFFAALPDRSPRRG